MKMKSLLWILLGSTAIYGAVLSSANAQNSPMPNQQNNKKIECEERNGTYYTMLNREEGSYRIIEWGEKRIGTDSYVLPIRYDDLAGQDWTRVPYPVIGPETRCQTVSQRLNSIYTGYSNRELILYTTRVPVTVNVDGSPVGRNWSYQSTVRPFVVCVDGLDCNNRGMVFTITTNYEDEAETILNKFVEVLQNPERDEPITLGSIRIPRVNENGDYYDIAEAFAWEVKDLPNGLNCRSGPGTEYSVVEVKSPNQPLSLATIHFVGGGPPYINLDESGLPWLKVDGGYETHCFVRANTEFIEPTSEGFFSRPF